MKKKIKLLIIFLLALIFIVCLNGKVNAAMEIKDGASAYQTNASDAYQMCYDLRNPTSTLSKNSLDPHLTLNADWAAAAYLGLSGYGGATNNSATYTTGNNSGVRTWPGFGQRYYWTSSIYEEVSNSTSTEISNLYKNMNTKYVEKLKAGSEQKKGLGFDETKSIVDNNANVNSSYLIPCKYQYLNTHSVLISFNTGNPRPVIWN